jgi:hypothetical protein
VAAVLLALQPEDIANDDAQTSLKMKGAK